MIDSYDISWSQYEDSKRTFSARLQRRYPIAPWSPEIEYGEDSLVIHDGILFISQADPNLGHEPVVWTQSDRMAHDDNYWVPVRGSGLMGDKDYSTFTEIIGGEPNGRRDDGYVYCIPHHFNTHNLFVTARINNNMGPMEKVRAGFAQDEEIVSYQVDARYDVSDRGQVKVILNEPIPENYLVVSISPGGGVNDQSAVSFQATVEKGEPGGYAGLDDNRYILPENLPVIPLGKLPAVTSLEGGSENFIPTVSAVAGALDAVDRELDERPLLTDFGAWDSETIYHEGSVVVYGTRLYISMRNSNQGMVPETSPNDWREVLTASAELTVRRRTVIFGNDTDTEYVLNHGLDSMNLVFSVMRNDTHEFLYPRVFAQDLDNLKVIVDAAPGDAGLVLNVMDCRVRADIVDVEAVLFDEPSDTWVFDNPSGYPVMVWVNDSDGEGVEGDIVQPDSSGFNPVTVSFGTPVSGAMTVAKADLVEPLDSLELVIDLAEKGLDPSKLYAVQVYAEGDTGMAETEIIQEIGSGKIVIRTNDADGVEGSDVKGYVLLREASAYAPFTLEDEEVTYNHSLGRAVGIQVFQDNGEVAGTLTSCPTKDSAYAYVKGYGGYMLMV